jgi:hypothetical protein
MTNEEIINLAGHREVPAWVMKLIGDAVAKERAECAKIAEEKIDKLNWSAPNSPKEWWELASKTIASEIRQRGQQ